MILIAILRESTVEGKKKAKGRKIKTQYFLAFDRYNCVLAIKRGSIIQGDKFYLNINQLSHYLTKELKFDEKELRITISNGLNKIFGTNFKPRSFSDIDRNFEIGIRDPSDKCTLVIYKKLKTIAGDQNDEENCND